MSVETQEAIRKRICKARAQLDKAALDHAGDALFEQLKTLTCFNQANYLTGYLAIRGEMPLQHTAWHSHHRGASIYLPVVDGLNIHFAPWLTPDHEYPLAKSSQFGIEEPIAPIDSYRLANEFDVMLIPLVAFDEQCNRMGMGGGFYDRTLAFRLQQPSPPVLIGVAHELQKVDALPCNPWDVPLDYIVTDQAIYRRPTATDEHVHL